MARRGDKLRDHILWTAKDVFLEMGFERASMDVVAARAETSKRSLYAHFESKEKLFLAVIELVRRLFMRGLRQPADYSDKPADYSDKPAEALTLFCARYLEIMLYQPSVQLSRVCMAEIARFPEGAAQSFDLVFTEVHTLLSAYLKGAFSLSPRASAGAAHRLMGQVLYPRYTRALFGMDALKDELNPEGLSPDFDLKPIRKIVADFVESLREP